MFGENSPDSLSVVLEATQRMSSIRRYWYDKIRGYNSAPSPVLICLVQMTSRDLLDRQVTLKFVATDVWQWSN